MKRKREIGLHGKVIGDVEGPAGETDRSHAWRAKVDSDYIRHCQASGCDLVEAAWIAIEICIEMETW